MTRTEAARVVRRNPSAPFEFVDDRAVRPVVAVAGVGELSQRARNFRERLGAVLEVGHMCERERFHFGAGALRSAYPKARFNVITNGALIDDDKIEFLDKLGFGVGISHDGPAMRYRGPDPLDDPTQRAAIRKLYDRLRPWGRIGFNCVLHKHNTSLAAVRPKGRYRSRF